MNCFQHIPESRGAIAQPPRGGATKKKADPTTQHALIGFKHPHLPQPSALHNRTCPCPLTSDRTRNARAPTSPRSIGFCAIWDCISSSSSSSRDALQYRTAEMPTDTDGRDAPQYRQQRCSPISGRDALQYRSAPLSRPSAFFFTRLVWQRAASQVKNYSSG